jgi:flagellar motor protein MotB
VSAEEEVAGTENEVWPAFADLFSAFSFILLLLVIVTLRIARGEGEGPGGMSSTRRQLLGALTAASDSGNLFRIDSSTAQIRLTFPDSLMFPTGAYSAGSLLPVGRDAVVALARVLWDSSLSRYYSTVHVVGHTDQLPVIGPTVAYQDNWDLSARRAVTVARIIMDAGSIDPCAMRATGAGAFHPVDTVRALSRPGSPENRRVEISLLPWMGVDSTQLRSCFRRGDRSTRTR